MGLIIPCASGVQRGVVADVVVAAAALMVEAQRARVVVSSDRAETMMKEVSGLKILRILDKPECLKRETKLLKPAGLDLLIPYTFHWGSRAAVTLCS